jgi:hypothetical protein
VGTRIFIFGRVLENFSIVIFYFRYAHGRYYPPYRSLFTNCLC